MWASGRLRVVRLYPTEKLPMHICVTYMRASTIVEREHGLRTQGTHECEETITSGRTGRVSDRCDCQSGLSL